MITRIKWNWGTGITLVYTTFAVAIISFVVYSFKQRIDLVTPDYYAKELIFQEQIEKEQRTRALAEPLSWERNENTITMQFPTISGISRYSADIQFFNPANASLDHRVSVTADAGRKALISLNKLQSGRYTMKVNWTGGSTKYYSEGIVVIP